MSLDQKRKDWRTHVGQPQKNEPMGFFFFWALPLPTGMEYGSWCHELALLIINQLKLNYHRDHIFPIIFIICRYYTWLHLLVILQNTYFIFLLAFYSCQGFQCDFTFGLYILVEVWLRSGAEKTLLMLSCFVFTRSFHKLTKFLWYLNCECDRHQDNANVTHRYTHRGCMGVITLCRLIEQLVNTKLV